MCRIFCTCMAMHDAMTDSARIGSQELSGTLPHCRTAPQPPAFSHRQQPDSKLHAAMWQREQLAAFETARERGVSLRTVDAYRAAFGVKLTVDAAAVRAARRLPRPITSGQIHGQIIYDTHHLLSKMSAHGCNGEDVLR